MMLSGRVLGVLYKKHHPKLSVGQEEAELGLKNMATIGAKDEKITVTDIETILLH
jgi:hypothetical protein